MFFLITTFICFTSSQFLDNDLFSHSKNVQSENCTALGVDYTGNKTRTKSGKRCRIWPQFYQDTYTRANLGNHRYCRNPTYDFNGVYCVVGYKDRDFVIEYCDVTCTEGFVIQKYNFVCASKENVLQETGSLGECAKKCLEKEGCAKFSYKMGLTQCYECNPTEKGVIEIEWIMFIYYDPKNVKRCTLAQSILNDMSIESTYCLGEMNQIQCEIGCNPGYIGWPYATCSENKGIFNVVGRCEAGCYINKATISSKIDFKNCLSSPYKLKTPQNCAINCNSQNDGHVTISCPRPGAEFIITNTCRTKRCYIADYNKAEYTGMNFSNCQTAVDSMLTENECEISCESPSVGYIKPVCDKSSKIFRLQGECYTIETEKESNSTETGPPPLNSTETGLPPLNSTETGLPPLNSTAGGNSTEGSDGGKSMASGGNEDGSNEPETTTAADSSSSSSSGSIFNLFGN